MLCSHSPLLLLRCLLLQRSRRAPAAAAGLCEHQLCLYVRWHSAAGGVKVNRLPLDPISGVDDLRGLSRWAPLLLPPLQVGTAAAAALLRPL